MRRLHSHTAEASSWLAMFALKSIGGRCGTEWGAQRRLRLPTPGCGHGWKLPPPAARRSSLATDVMVMVLLSPNVRAL